jgi:hypothetical protein
MKTVLAVVDHLTGDRQRPGWYANRSSTDTKQKETTMAQPSIHKTPVPHKTKDIFKPEKGCLITVKQVSKILKPRLPDSAIF